MFGWMVLSRWIPAATALVIGMAMAGAPMPAVACSVCGCGDPLVDVSDSVPFAAPLRIALDFEVLTASAASDEEPSATERVTQVTLRPVIVYSPTEELNLVLQVPLVHKDWSRSGGEADGSMTHMGLGDIDVGARWFFFQRTSFETQSRQAIGVTGGITLPTGPNGATDNGVRVDDHAQLGTGAFGPYLGLSYAYHRDPWNLFASITGRIRTRNSYDYRYGNALQWSVRGDYRVIDEFSLELGIDGRRAARDTVLDEEQTHTGGFVLAAAPGVAVNLYEDLWLRARVQIPFITSLYGTQTVGPTYFASVQVLLR
jgi:hypothetical protein